MVNKLDYLRGLDLGHTYDKLERVLEGSRAWIRMINKLVYWRGLGLEKHMINKLDYWSGLELGIHMINKLDLGGSRARAYI